MSSWPVAVAAARGRCTGLSEGGIARGGSVVGRRGGGRRAGCSTARVLRKGG